VIRARRAASRCRHTISFLFQKAGKYEFAEGRSIVETDKFISIDDRPYRFVFETYTPATDKREMQPCGPNV